MIKHKFVEAVHNYQQVEQLYRGKYKQRLERQFLVGEFSHSISPVFIEIVNVFRSET